VVANTLVTTSAQNIDVTAFEVGIYTVRVVCGEKVYAQKLIIE
jgi:hypothetical protein